MCRTNVDLMSENVERVFTRSVNAACSGLCV